MSYRFRIAGPIEKPKARDVWRLHIKSMSGDADEFNTVVKDFKDLMEMERHLKVIAAFFTLSWNQGCDDELARETMLKVALEQGWDKGQFGDFHYDMVGRDVTYSDVMRRPHKMWVTYFDNVGVEHHVNIMKDGEYINGFQRS